MLEVRILKIFIALKNNVPDCVLGNIIGYLPVNRGALQPTLSGFPEMIHTNANIRVTATDNGAAVNGPTSKDYVPRYDTEGNH